MGGAMHAAARRASGECRPRACRRSRLGRRRRQDREEARKIMKELGYGPDKPLKIKVSGPQLRRLSRAGRDPDRPAQADLLRRRARRRSRPRSGTIASSGKDYIVATNSGGSARRRSGRHVLRGLCLQLASATTRNYCNPRTCRPASTSSRRTVDPAKRKALVQKIDHDLQAADVRPPDHLHHRSSDLLASPCQGS